MKKILAIGCAAGALMAVSSVASAQEDCLNGWRMIKEQIPVRCDVLPSAFSGPVVPNEEPFVEEPLYTGSIAAAPIEEPFVEEPMPVEEPLATGAIAAEESEMPPRPGAPEAPVASFSASRDECQPGQFWMMELNSGNRPVACE